jgi:hypothetical protein
MRVSRALAACIVVSPFLAVPFSAAQALTVTIENGAFLDPTKFAGYGESVGKNNVINRGGFKPSSVTDNSSVAGSTFLGGNGSYINVISTSTTSYGVDWYYVGAESGFDITLKVFQPPSVPPAITHQENNRPSDCNNCSSGGNDSPNERAAKYLGTTSYAATDADGDALTFKLNASVGNGVNNATGNNNAPYQVPLPGNPKPSLVFSFTNVTLGGETPDVDPFEKSAKKWELALGNVNTLTDFSIWVLFAFNDTGGPDDNHDDYIGLARIFATGSPVDPPVPIPGAFVLMGTVLAAAGGVAKWRRRRKASAA